MIDQQLQQCMISSDLSDQVNPCAVNACYECCTGMVLPTTVKEATRFLGNDLYYRVAPTRAAFDAIKNDPTNNLIIVLTGEKRTRSNTPGVLNLREMKPNDKVFILIPFECPHLADDENGMKVCGAYGTERRLTCCGTFEYGGKGCDIEREMVGLSPVRISSQSQSCHSCYFSTHCNEA